MSWSRASSRSLVCHAGHVKKLPGRTTDLLTDADWLVHLLECGLLAGSFIPPGGHQGRPGRVPNRAKVAQQRVSEIARLGTCCKMPGSRSTQWRPPSLPSAGGR
jgi:transposase